MINILKFKILKKDKSTQKGEKVKLNIKTFLFIAWGARNSGQINLPF